MKILFTGFEPFGGETVNPSFEAVRRLPERLGTAEIFKAEIPVSFADSGPALEAAMASCHPDAVICVGQAGGYAALAVERVAINLRDAATPDNRGLQPSEQPVVPGGPDACFATLAVKRLAAALREGGIPAFVSNSAGTYVCNNLMYTLLERIHRDNLPVRGGFIHVPYAPEQAAGKAPGTPSMALEQITHGLELAVGVLSAEEAHPADRTD